MSRSTCSAWPARPRLTAPTGLEDGPEDDLDSLSDEELDLLLEQLAEDGMTSNE